MLQLSLLLLLLLLLLLYLFPTANGVLPSDSDSGSTTRQHKNTQDLNVSDSVLSHSV
jgi:hypothetical protein